MFDLFFREDAVDGTLAVFVAEGDREKIHRSISRQCADAGVWVVGEVSEEALDDVCEESFRSEDVQASDVEEGEERKDSGEVGNPRLTGDVKRFVGEE